MALARRRTAASRTDRRTTVAVALGLAGYVGVVYTVLVVGGSALIGHRGSPAIVLSILATAVVALSFEPVQARLTRRIAELWPVPASPYDVLSRFTEAAVTDDVDDQPLRMARILAEGTAARETQVWLKVDDDLACVAAWPSTTEASPAPPQVWGSVHRLTQTGWRSLPVLDDGLVIGVLSVRQPDDQTMTPVEERLFAGLATQAGLVLRSARLRTELSQRLVDLSQRAADLTASRERLIEMQDAERKRLERDIHDGAQQNLVALAVNLRLAQRLVARSPERAAEVIAAQSEAAASAIGTLLQLSRGIEPAVLAEHGLVSALTSVAQTSALQVRVDADSELRLPLHIEAALYFCCLEALQNAAKHSGGTIATITLRRTQAGVTLSVVNDGRSFDSTQVTAGAGLANMRDRVDSVGGTLTLGPLESGGTRIDVTLSPLALAATVVAS
jgi:signal transduction histidine kinase